MKRYNEVFVKDTKDVRKDLLGSREGKEHKEGLSEGYGQDGEDFTESEEGGLSEGEGEEGGDFMGDGEVNNSGKSGQNKMKVKNEPEASAGKIQTDPDFSKIETGTTGSNRNKDYIQEKKGSAEGEIQDRSLEHRNPE